jgi:hypothetical protein
VTAAKNTSAPIHFLMQTETTLRPIDIDYHEGMKYPVLVRVDGSKDYLDEITTPLTKSPTPSPTTK